MKKNKYNKPYLHIEKFSLLQNIATGCNAKPKDEDSSIGNPNHWDKTTCGWDMGNYIIWIDADMGCDWELGADEGFDGYCYHNPNGGNTIFSS